MDSNFLNYHTHYGINSNFDVEEEKDQNDYLETSSGRKLPFKRFGRKKTTLFVHEKGVLQKNKDFSLVERQFSENKNFDFTAAEKLTSENDVAWMFRTLEDSSVEQTFLVYHFEDESYFVQHLSTGGINAALIDFRLFTGNMLSSKPKAVTFVHNHPSGTLKPSKSDYNILSRLKKFCNQYEIHINNGIIINTRSGQFVSFSPTGFDTEILQEQIGEKNRVKVHSFDKQLFVDNYQPKKIKDELCVAAYISTQKYGLSDKTELLVLNNNSQINAKFILPQQDQLKKIIELSTLYGGTSVIIYGNNITQQMFDDYDEKLEELNIELIDALRFEGKNIVSLKSEFLITEKEIQMIRDSVVAEEQAEYSTTDINSTDILNRLKSAFPFTKVNFLSADQINEKLDEIKSQAQINLFNETSETILTSAFFAPEEKKETELSKIEDYGEKIGGARKDLYQTQISLLEDITAFNFSSDHVDLNHNIYKKGIAELLPFPNLSALTESGYNKEVLKMLISDYSQIQKKPILGTYRSGRRVNNLLSWYTRIQTIANSIKALYLYSNDKEFVNNINEKASEKWEASMFSGNDALRFHVLEEVFDKTGLPNEDYNFKLFRGFEISKSYFNDLYNIKIGNHKEFKLDKNNISDFIISKISKEEKEENRINTLKKEKEIKIYCYKNNLRDTYFLGYKLKNGELYSVSEEFENAEITKQYYDDNKEELKNKVRIYETGLELDIRSKVNEKRDGLNYRSHFPDGNVPIDEFANQFGFRGIEFGNYVNNKERQEHINKAYDGFMDMANVLNIPPNAISLNSELGIGFGSRGRGGKNAAAAHYEPSKIVINLTKNNGAGSLAHEWWHAFDHYMARSYVQNQGASYLSESHRMGSVRTEIFNGYDKILDVIQNDTDILKRSKAADGGAKTAYFSSRKELTARTFESYIKDKLFEDQIKNDYLVNILPAVFFGDKEEMYPYPTEAEQKIINASYDLLFSNIQVKTENNKVIMFHATESQDILGFTHDNSIYLNKEKINNETLIHEFGHIWVDALEINNPELYERGISLLEEGGEDYILSVKNNPFYKSFSEQQLKKEALVLAIGDRGNKILQKNNTYQKFNKFLGDVKNFIGETFFFQKKEKIESLTLDHFLDSAVFDLLQGENLSLDKKIVEETSTQIFEDKTILITDLLNKKENENLSYTEIYSCLLVCYIDFFNSEQKLDPLIFKAYNSLTDEQKQEFELFVKGFKFEAFNDENMASIDSEHFLQLFKEDMAKYDNPIEISIGIYSDNGDKIDFQPYKFENFDELFTYLDIQRSNYNTDPVLAVKVNNETPVWLLDNGAHVAFKNILEEVIDQYNLNIKLQNPSENKKTLNTEFDQDNKIRFNTDIKTENEFNEEIDELINNAPHDPVEKYEYLKARTEDDVFKYITESEETDFRIAADQELQKHLGNHNFTDYEETITELKNQRLLSPEIKEPRQTSLEDENYKKLQANIISKIESIWYYPEQNNNYIEVDNQNIKMVDTEWRDWGKREYTLSFSQAKERLLKLFTEEEKEIITISVKSEEFADDEEHDDLKILETMKITFQERNIKTSQSENIIQIGPNEGLLTTNNNKNTSSNNTSNEDRENYRQWLYDMDNTINIDFRKITIHQFNKMFVTLDTYELEKTLEDFNVPKEIIQKANKIEDWLENDLDVKTTKSLITYEINHSTDNIQIFKERYSDMVKDQSNFLKK